MMPDAKKLFETLMREHTEMLVVYLRAALGNSPDVDDLFQETMVVAWRRLDDFDPTRPFGQWLRGIAKRLVLAHRRRRAHRPCDVEMLDQIDLRLAQIGARRGDTWEEKLLVVRECVEALPLVYRESVQLRYFQRLAIKQVSERMAQTEAAIKKRLQRARCRILDCLEQKLPATGNA